jgi:hypothetical protein
MRPAAPASSRRSQSTAILIQRCNADEGCSLTSIETSELWQRSHERRGGNLTDARDRAKEIAEGKACAVNHRWYRRRTANA